MRAIQSCVLRLIIDGDNPGEFKGKVHFVENRRDCVFQNEHGLLTILRQYHEDFVHTNQQQNTSLTNVRDPSTTPTNGG